MSNKSKIVLSLFFSMIMHVSFSMDEKTTDKIPSSQISQQQNTVSFPMPTLNGLINCVANGIESLRTTAINHISDDAAFKKLGWPRNDAQAEHELSVTLQKYGRINDEEYFGQRDHYMQTIFRRTEYLMRLWKVMEQRSDGVMFVQHCLKYHSFAMTEVLKKLFNEYLDKKAAEFKEGKETARIVENEMDTIKPILLRIGWTVDGRVQEAKNNLKKCQDAYIIKSQFKEVGGEALLREAEERKRLGITECEANIFMINNESHCQKFIRERTADINQIYDILPKIGDGMDLAVHCLKNHRCIMTEFVADDFHRFISTKQRVANELYKEPSYLSIEFQEPYL